MRISDWSSDVCSSDLLRRKYGRRCFRLADDHLPAAEALVVLPQRRLESSRIDDQITCAERPGHPAPAIEVRGNSGAAVGIGLGRIGRSEEHTSELQSLMRISYAVFCLKKKKRKKNTT